MNNNVKTFKKIGFIAMMVILASISSSCSNVINAGPAAFTFVTSSGHATQRAKVTKTGTACAHNVLGLVAWGDSSYTAAKKQGSISKISHVDYDVMSIFGIFTKVCTVISGS